MDSVDSSRDTVTELACTSRRCFWVPKKRVASEESSLCLSRALDPSSAVSLQHTNTQKQVNNMQHLSN